MYDPAASTLTLDGATLNTLYSDAEGNWGCVIFAPNRDLTIVLKGANTITCSGSGYLGIQAPSSALTITGDGTLDITSVRDCIQADEIVMDGAKLSLDGDNGLYACEGKTVLHNKAVVTLRNGANATPGIRKDGRSRAHRAVACSAAGLRHGDCRSGRALFYCAHGPLCQTKRGKIRLRSAAGPVFA